jgi:hypothetical protein
MPSQLSQEIVFTEEFAVTFAVTGTGSVLPASGYYAEGSNLTLLATSSSHPFYDWKTTASKVYVGNTKNAGTNATVKASTTVTAVFKSSGSICSSKCSLTFNEVGLPTGSSWGVTFGGSSYPITGSSLALSGLSTSYYYWSAFTPVGLGQYGVAYVPLGTSAGYYYLGQTTSIEVVYEKVAYVTFASNPTYPSGGGASAGGGAITGSNWYPVGSVNPLSAYNGTAFDFSSWTSSGSNVALGSTNSASSDLGLLQFHHLVDHRHRRPPRGLLPVSIGRNLRRDGDGVERPGYRGPPHRSGSDVPIVRLREGGLRDLRRQRRNGREHLHPFHELVLCGIGARHDRGERHLGHFRFVEPNRRDRYHRLYVSPLDVRNDPGNGDHHSEILGGVARTLSSTGGRSGHPSPC